MLTDKQYNKLRSIAKNFIPSKDLDDVLSEAVLSLLENKPKLQSLIDTGDLYRYFNRVCKNLYYSKTSKYHYKYNKIKDTLHFTDTLRTEIEDDNLYNIVEDSDLINEILSELYWYDRELFKLYVLGDNNGKRYTLDSIAKKTGISRMSIYITIKGVKSYVRKRLKEVRNGI